jgi:hypothetical protein
MHNKCFLPAIIFLIFLVGCAASKNYNGDKKYSAPQLQQDYTLLRNILEKKHPSLYWYTPKDSMDYFFDKGYQNITDSMTELKFGWDILAPVINKIRCGHTSFGMSKGWYKFIENKTIPSFPLHLKVWGDTMVVLANLNRKDSILKKGTIITSINGMGNHELIQTMLNYLSQDGYSDNVNYVRISSNFPFYHRNVFGIYKNYRVGYIDSSTGEERKTLIHMFISDSVKNKEDSLHSKISWHKTKKLEKENSRSFTIDTSINTAVITLNTFSKGGGRHLRCFFRKSFRCIRKQQIKNLILDLRSNGGGDIDMYALLTKYLRNTPFKVADSVYAIAKTLHPYSKYIKSSFFDNLGLFFFTKKHADGNYHYGYWERHLFKPKTLNHFNGKAYVLINGPTFSASTLFCNAVKGQSNIKLVGEETGGGWYGNNGIMIPDIVLPITKLRVRLPLFRIVQYHHIAEKGTGVLPDIFIPPTVEGVRKSIDRKMQITKEMIKKDIHSNQ